MNSKPNNNTNQNNNHQSNSNHQIKNTSSKSLIYPFITKKIYHSNARKSYIPQKYVPIPISMKNKLYHQQIYNKNQKRFHHMNNTANIRYHQFKNNKSIKIRALRLLYWNVNGGLHYEHKNHHEILNYVQQYSPHILLTQETIGTIGGYKKNRKHKIQKLPQMNLICNDQCSITSIFIHESIKKYIPIPFPNELFQNQNPKNIIHATAVIIFIDSPIRNRNNIVILNLYRSPNKNAVNLSRIQVVLHHIKHFMNDTQPNIIIGGDLNFWAEYIGSDPRERTTYKRKFTDGDDILHSMEMNNIININTGEPTMWKRKKRITKEYHVDSLWIHHQFYNQININPCYNNSIKLSDHYPNEITINNLVIPHKTIKSKQIWNLNNISTNTWDEFRDIIQKNMDEFQQILDQLMNQQQYSKGQIMHVAMDVMQQIITNAAEQTIGRKTIHNIDKPYINDEIMQIINDVHTMKKRNRHIMNTVRNIKNEWRRSHDEALPESELKHKLGTKHYQIYKCITIKDKQKKKLIQTAKRKGKITRSAN